MQHRILPIVRRVVSGLGVAFALLAAGRATATPYVTLGPSDGFALDQPRVSIAVVDPGTQQDLGPELSNSFLLDTGANDILVGGNAVSELTDSGYQTVAQYDDFGIGGTVTLDVSKAYEVDFAGDDGVPIAIPGSSNPADTSHTRLLSGPNVDVGFDGVMGMPAMVHRTTTVDMTGWSGGNFDTLHTSFSNAAPPVVGSQYHVALNLQNFPPTGQHNPNDPLPTFAPLSTAPVEVQNQGHLFDTRFIVDTGAQISIISTATAAALGIDPVRDAVDQLELGGIAGSVTVPVVNVDSLALRTTEGVNLVWTGLQVGVYDIDPSIAGIFGMDFLTSGWFGALFGGPDGYLNKVAFDFRNSAQNVGTMVLDVNPSLNHVAIIGDLNHDGIVNGQDLALVASHWLQTGASIQGDINGDGLVNGQDLALVASNWLSTTGGAGAGAAVPEPSGWTLAILAGVGIWCAGRRRQRGVRASVTTISAPIAASAPPPGSGVSVVVPAIIPTP